MSSDLASAAEERAYRGTPIDAAANVHRVVLDLLTTLGVARSARILEIGAGAGAFTARLVDAGFAHLTACDIDGSRFNVSGVSCVTTNVEDPAAAGLLGGPFEAIVAIEVIEHLENPSQFLRTASSLLAPTGLLLVTSPNTTSWYSRMAFLREGRLHWFGTDRYHRDGHRSPIFDWQMEAIGRAARLEVVARTSTDPALLRLKYLFPRGALGALLRRTTYLYLLLRPLMKGACEGELRVWALRRT